MQRIQQLSGAAHVHVVANADHPVPADGALARDPPIGPHAQSIARIKTVSTHWQDGVHVDRERRGSIPWQEDGAKLSVVESIFRVQKIPYATDDVAWRLSPVRSSTSTSGASGEKARGH